MGIPLHAPESALPAVAVPSAVPVPCTLVDAGAEGAAAQQLGVRSGFWRFSAISTQGSQRLRCKSPLRTECAVA